MCSNVGKIYSFIVPVASTRRGRFTDGVIAVFIQLGAHELVPHGTSWIPSSALVERDPFFRFVGGVGFGFVFAFEFVSRCEVRFGLGGISRGV